MANLIERMRTLHIISRNNSGFAGPWLEARGARSSLR